MSAHTIHEYGGNSEVSRDFLAALGEEKVREIALAQVRRRAVEDGWTVLPGGSTFISDDPLRERADTHVVLAVVLRVYKP